MHPVTGLYVLLPLGGSAHVRQDDAQRAQGPIPCSQRRGFSVQHSGATEIGWHGGRRTKKAEGSWVGNTAEPLGSPLRQKTSGRRCVGGGTSGKMELSADFSN